RIEPDDHLATYMLCRDKERAREVDRLEHHRQLLPFLNERRSFFLLDADICGQFLQTVDDILRRVARFGTTLRQQDVHFLDRFDHRTVLAGVFLVLARGGSPLLLDQLTRCWNVLLQRLSDQSAQVSVRFYASLDVPDTEVVIQVRIELNLDAYEPVRIVYPRREHTWNIRIRHLSLTSHKGDRAEVFRNAD